MSIQGKPSNPNTPETHSKKSHPERRRKKNTRRRRQILLRRIAAVVIAVIIVLVVVLIRLVYVSRTRLDTSQAYNLAAVNGTEDLSGFALQSTSTYTESEGIVCSGSEEGTDSLSLSESDERALLFNIEDHSCLYASGIYDKIYPASLTKIMTALVTLESNANLTQKVTMTDDDFSLGEDAQTSQLDVGDTVTLNDLLNLLLVYSANDAAMAIARTVGGSVDSFVDMMNQEAQKIGMTGTHFMNPSGLHDDQHYTTPYDIYLMLNRVYQDYPDFSKIASQSQFQTTVTGTEGDSTFISTTTDEYLDGTYSLPADIQILASKTGTTDEAGSCLALVVQNSYSVPFIAIVTGADTKDTLYGDMSKLLNLANQDSSKAGSTVSSSDSAARSTEAGSTESVTSVSGTDSVQSVSSAGTSK
ncbi:MAG: serine hydrolase [Eubacterium sp.]|nr:serine hydrolase [Eubacterium sp.]